MLPAPPAIVAIAEFHMLVKFLIVLNFMFLYIKSLVSLFILFVGSDGVEPPEP